jgi:hypothetical protein
MSLRERTARGHKCLDAPDRNAAHIDGEIEPAVVQVTRSLKPGPEAGLIGELGDGHGIGGHHRPPFLIDLTRPQRPEHQPRSADPDVSDTSGDVLPILWVHNQKLT